MKFKKTKLTALALSVLMAASTITSTTWAADLFTDGSSLEEEATGAVFVSEGVEPTVEEENNILPTVTASAPVYTVDKDGKGHTVAIVGSQIIWFDLYGVSNSNTIQVKYKSYDGEDIDLKNVTEEYFDGSEINSQSCEVGKNETSNCVHPERHYCEFTYAGETFHAYKLGEDVDSWSKKGVEKHDFKPHTITVLKGDCETKGIAFIYRQCTACNLVHRIIINWLYSHLILHQRIQLPPC